MIHLAIAIALAAGPASRPAPDMSRVSDLAGYAKGLWNQIEGYKQKIAALEQRVKDLEATISKQNESYADLSRKWAALPDSQKQLAEANLKKERDEAAKKRAEAGSRSVRIGMTVSELAASLGITDIPQPESETANSKRYIFTYDCTAGYRSTTCAQLFATFRDGKLASFTRDTYSPPPLRAVQVR